MEKFEKNVILNNGVSIPALGFGTYKIDDNDVAYRCVSDALQVGYRHIDTAFFYENEVGVGRAIKDSGLDRKDVFLTTKIWTTDCGYDNALFAVDRALKLLNLDYIDLMLIHWPTKKNRETWRAFERLVEEKALRAIGLSNFKEHHIEDLLVTANIVPAINQVEFNPLFQQIELREYCKNHGIRVEAWAPLLRGKTFELKSIEKLAEKYGKTPAQIVLRWDLQSGVVTIPKTTHKERMIENFDVFDFELTAEDMEMIAKENINVRQYRDPDNHGF